MTNLDISWQQCRWKIPTIFSSQIGYNGQSSNAFLGLRPSNELLGSDDHDNGGEGGGDGDGNMLMSKISGGSNTNVSDELGGSGNSNLKNEEEKRDNRNRNCIQ